MDTQRISQVNTLLYAHYVLFAWVIYEHLITLDREIRCVWFHKFTKGSVIFYLNRYAVLSMVIVLLIKDNIPSVHSCAMLQRLNEALILITCFCASFFSAWRVSVIWDKNPLIFITIFVLVVPPFVMYATTSANSHRNYLYIQETQQVWCQAVCGLSATIQAKMNIVTRVPVLVGDTLAVLLTWAKTYKNVKVFRALESEYGNTTLGTGIGGIGNRRERGSVMASLMRDGTLYFVALVILSLSMLLVRNTTLVTSILHACQGVLVSRFILDLREVPLGNDEIMTEANWETGGPGSGWECGGYVGDDVNAGRIGDENFELSQLNLYPESRIEVTEH